MQEGVRADPFVVGDLNLAKPEVALAAEEFLRVFHDIKRDHQLSQQEAIAALAVMVGCWSHADNRGFFKVAMTAVEKEMEARKSA